MALHNWQDAPSPAVDNNSVSVPSSGYPSITISPLGSRGAALTATALKGVVLLETGCFRGSWAAFDAALRETHQDNAVAQEYRLALDFIRQWLTLHGYDWWRAV